MRVRILSTLSAVLFLSLTVLGASKTDPMHEMLNPPLPEGVDIIKDVVYRVVDDQTLMMDVYVPPSVGDGVAPAVIYVHGGGWAAGSREKSFGGKRDTYPLLSAGFVVVSIDYRLAPKNKFPAQIQDVKSAVRFVRANAKRFQIDPDRIGAMGESAGGHLVALLGLAGRAAGFDVGENLEQSSAVKAVVDIYGAHDLPRLKQRQLTKEIVERAFSDDLLEAGSPVTYIAKDSPPFLVIHGDKDSIALVEQSDLFVEALKSAHAPAEYIRVKNAQHGFWQVEAPIDPPMEKITEAIVTFFQEKL